MGPGGSAFVIEALTDNKSRTVSQVKSCFSKAAASGASMSPTSYMFNRRGWIETGLKPGVVDFDGAFEDLIELEGVEDIEEKKNNTEQEDEEAIITEDNNNNEKEIILAIYTPYQETAKVAEALKTSGYPIKDMGIEYAPNQDSIVNANDLTPDAKKAYEKLAQTLDDLDDVLEIYTNVV